MSVVEIYKNILKTNRDVVVSVAVVETLTVVVKESKASTIMGLEVELKAAADELRRHSAQNAITMTAACELFNRYVMRTLSEIPDFTECRHRIISRGEQFEAVSLKAKTRISQFGDQFIHDESSILVHGHSRIVLALLLFASKQLKRFCVYLTECYPLQERSHRFAQDLRDGGIEVTMISDLAVGFYMEKVDSVLLGAEGVVENGGVVNCIGTYQICMVAKAMNCPVYIAAESFKFARLFPLTQSDVPNVVKEESGVMLPLNDYTPPSLITLLFTDLGILTPSAVSDELIKLYF